MPEKIVITRNYSRREGTEMFSLTINREIDGNSTFLRQRAESYLALYDVEIQVLEEMVPLNYVTPVFFTKRRRGIAEQLLGLRKKLIDEIGSGTITSSQIVLNEETLNSMMTRLGDILPPLREYTPKPIQ